MSVSLASPDGRVVGGGVAGLLVAASPVQVLLLIYHNDLNTYEFGLSTKSNSPLILIYTILTIRFA